MIIQNNIHNSNFQLCITELVKKLLAPLGDVVLEKMRVTAEQACVLGDNVNVSHLGMGSSVSTWYGSPDARLRGCVPNAETPILMEEG